MQIIDNAGRWAEPDATGATYVQHHATRDLSVGTYSLRVGANDDQSPHTEDEVYVVTARPIRHQHLVVSRRYLALVRAEGD